ncbi:FkbM family methyltransferase [Nostoc sp. ChiQUE01b]|uniref:FkbM family methyltransferase n=1 Tax=Nostoc sp. ChiQUE01b TaxID=3075376 RepID=UPI002AD2961E|nr:FkbM family methyltransferase [Nostoc sp. ChiQUE01b]MDZ8261514.1 FkbM family methyltransferase [Nostoc sp. ChiQUE01b]
MIVTGFRTFLRTNPITGTFLSWIWKHYITAICESAPDDLSHIPKVKDAGKIFIASDDSSKRYQLMHNGVKIKVNSYYKNLNTEIIKHLQGHHEPQEEKVFYEILKSLPEDISMIEVGSYWGYYSMWANQAKKSVCNILIEPIDEHMQIGKENFALNSMTAQFIRAYIGESSKKQHTKKLEGVTVKNLERISIDDLMKRYNLSFCHIIHADVQGAELELLKGANSTISNKKIGYFFISTHSKKLYLDCYSFLIQNNFHIVASHTREESFSADGLIVARLQSFPGIDTVNISINTNRHPFKVLSNYFLKRLFQKC